MPRAGFLSLPRVGLLFLLVLGLFTVVASPEAQGPGARLQWLKHLGSVAVARGLQRGDSVVVAHRLRCPEASGIF